MEREGAEREKGGKRDGRVREGWGQVSFFFTRAKRGYELVWVAHGKHMRAHVHSRLGVSYAWTWRAHTSTQMK